MKKIIAIAVFILVSASIGSAQDLILTGKLDNVTSKISQKGNPYTILSIPENRELNGVKYITSVSVFSFTREEAVKKLKTGDTVKMVVKKTTDKTGNEFYTLIALLK
jgi:hypothetical protein